jgi:hypothetical protein
MGMDVDYVAERAAFYREKVVFPAAARRAVLEHELTYLKGRSGNPLRSLLARAGAWLIRLGERLQTTAASGAAAHG